MLNPNHNANTLLYTKLRSKIFKTRTRNATLPDQILVGGAQKPLVILPTTTRAKSPGSILPASRLAETLSILKDRYVYRESIIDSDGVLV